MRKFLVITAIVVSILGFRSITTEPNDPAEIKTAINKSLPLLQSSSHQFLVNAGGCHSCHGQGLGGVTFSMAKEKGFAVADSIVNEAMDSISNNWTARMPYLAQNEDPVAIVMSGGYDLWALSATKYKTNKTIQLLARNIMHRQKKEGNWVSPNLRPPLEYYSFSATALALKGIQAHLPPVFQKETQQRVEKAKNWMMTNTPVANEERVFQLLGLVWSNGDKHFINKQAKNLLALQRGDGGWSQLDALPTDAYATGQSLYALNQCGELDVAAPAFQKGIAFLLRAQLDDGSWKIQTRSFPSVPYVDSGFPHGDSQFISAAGSNWATMALLLAAQ
jgi:N-acyl-D-amino-acid deacylase